MKHEINRFIEYFEFCISHEETIKLLKTILNVEQESIKSFNHFENELFHGDFDSGGNLGCELELLNQNRITLSSNYSRDILLGEDSVQVVIELFGKDEKLAQFTYDSETTADKNIIKIHEMVRIFILDTSIQDVTTKDTEQMTSNSPKNSPLGSKDNPMPIMTEHEREELRLKKEREKEWLTQQAKERERKLEEGELFEAKCPQCRQVFESVTPIEKDRICPDCYLKMNEELIRKEKVKMAWEQEHTKLTNTICPSCGLPINPRYGICGCK